MLGPSEQHQPWSSPQVCVLAFTCLLLGAVSGYLLRAPVLRGSAPPAMPAPARQVSLGQLTQRADQALRPLLQELQRKPNDAALLAQASKIYFAAHQFKAAQEYGERAAAAKPDAAVLTQLASAYYYTGDTDKAIASLNRALQVDPNCADALFNLGLIRWRAKSDPKAAVAYWKKLLATNPHHPRRAQVEQAMAQASREF